MKMKFLLVAALAALASASRTPATHRRRHARGPGRHSRHGRRHGRTVRQACPTTVAGHPFSQHNPSPTACQCPHGSYLRAQRRFSAGTARTHWRRIRHITYYCRHRTVHHVATCAVTGSQAATRSNPHHGYCRCPRSDANYRYFTRVMRHTSYSYQPRRRNNRYGRGGQSGNRYPRRTQGRGGQNRYRGRTQYRRRPTPPQEHQRVADSTMGGGHRRMQGQQYGARRGSRNQYGSQGRQRRGGRYGRNGGRNGRGYGGRGYGGRGRRVRHVTTSTYCAKVPMCPSGGSASRCYCPTNSRLRRTRAHTTCRSRTRRQYPRRGGRGGSRGYPRPQYRSRNTRTRPTAMRQPRRLQGRQQYGGRRGRTSRGRGGRSNRRRRPRRQRQCYTWRYSCQVVHNCPAAATSAAAAITAHSTKFCKCAHGTYLKRHVDQDYDFEGHRNTRTTVYYCDHQSMCPTHGYSRNYNCHCAAHETKEYRHVRHGTTTYFGAYCQRRAAFNPTTGHTHTAHHRRSWCSRYHFEQECQLARGCAWDPHTAGCSAGFSGDSAHNFHHSYIHRPTRRVARRPHH